MDYANTAISTTAQRISTADRIKSSGTLLGVAVVIGAALLLRYLHIQGLQHLFPSILDQTGLFLAMGALAGLVTLLLAGSLYVPLTMLDTTHQPDHPANTASRDGLLCRFGLLKWSRDCMKPLSPGEKFSSKCGFSILLIFVAPSIAWLLPAAALEYGYVSIGTSFGVLLLACLLAATWLLSCVFQPRGAGWLSWLAFIGMGVVIVWPYGVLLANLEQRADIPAFGEIGAIMLLALLYGVLLAVFYIAKRSGTPSNRIHAYGLSLVATFLIILIPGPMLELVGRFAGLEAEHQQVMLACPLPAEFSQTASTSPATQQQKKSAALASPEKRPATAWIQFATVFNLGGITVLCNPDAVTPGWTIPQRCLVARDGKPYGSFERHPKREH